MRTRRIKGRGPHEGQLGTTPPSAAVRHRRRQLRKTNRELKRRRKIADELTREAQRLGLDY
jgi:hypothetical protein